MNADAQTLPSNGLFKRRIEWTTVAALLHMSHAMLADVAAAQSRTTADAVVPAVASIHNRAPDYPPSAREKRIEGVVVVTFTVLEDGSVMDARVTSGPQELREATLHAVMTWHFQPARRAGMPVQSSQLRSVRFVLPR
jgi:TonB family protein